MDAKFQILILPPASFLSMPQRSYLYQGEDGNHNSFPTELLRTLVRGHLCRVLQARAAQGGSGLATALMGTHAHWGGGGDLFLQTHLMACSCPALSQTNGLPLLDLLVNFCSNFKALLWKSSRRDWPSGTPAGRARVGARRGPTLISPQAVWCGGPTQGASPGCSSPGSYLGKFPHLPVPQCPQL